MFKKNSFYVQVGQSIFWIFCPFLNSESFFRSCDASLRKEDRRWNTRRVSASTA